MSEIFLGNPGERFTAWCKAHYGSGETPDPVDDSDWGKVVQALENCSPFDFDLSCDYIGGDPLLSNLRCNAGVSDVKYAADSAGDAVDTTWVVLGYNASVPEYVKYRRAVTGGYVHVWVRSVKDGALAAVGAGDPAYTRAWDAAAKDWAFSDSGKTVASVGSGTFSYGNNFRTGEGAYDCRYSVPMSVTVDGKEYQFCGYNVTMNSEAIVKAAGTVQTSGGTSIAGQPAYNGVMFDTTKPGADYGRNRWTVSDIRDWMNGIHGGSLADRLAKDTADGFFRNVAKAVNRTWAHGDWKGVAPAVTGDVETVADRFWLLGNGHVNCTNTYYYGQDQLKDHVNDASRFVKTFGEVAIYQSDDSHIRYLMNADGTTGSSAGRWWLRSAGTDYGYSVGIVDEYGYVISSSAGGDSRGCVPACLIG